MIIFGKKELDSAPAFNDKFLKVKIGSGKNFTDFHVKDTPEVGLKYIRELIILIDSVLEK